MSAETLPHLKVMTPAARLLGREWLSGDRGTGVSRSRFHAPPEFANRHGTVHGGFLAAMLDSAAGLAVLDLLPQDMTMVTARLDVEYLKPAPLGTLEAQARVIARDERNVHIEAELATPDRVIVARARATMRIVKRRPKAAAE
ncbi:MAG: PaaI family thioesterase [Hyphomicrobiales bacterium]|nr:PaaI family thioesterase [Hyphomicrobiales bacterium]